MLIKPERFNPEKFIAIILPSSPPGKKLVRQSLQWLKRNNLKILFENNQLSKRSLKENVRILSSQFRSYLKNEDCSAIFAGRGGYGSNYLFDFLQETTPTKSKIIAGSSDFTFLLLFLLERKNMLTFYTPMPFTQNYKLFSRRKILAYFSQKKEIVLSGTALISGNASGVLKGGCLSNLVALCGTDFWPELSGTILFLEDVNERPYRLERMFWQLLNSKGFNNLRGIIIGNLKNCFRNTKERQEFFTRIRELLAPFKIPVGFNFQFGHLQKWFVIPLGVQAEILTSDHKMILRVNEEYLQ